jgi:drug/metabolite transporter (DMT)-like permease
MAGIGMWLIAHQFAPVGSEISFFRAVIAIILMGILNGIGREVLAPQVGNWWILAGFVSSVLVAKLFFRFSFVRAFFTVVAYSAFVFVLFVGVALLEKHN